MNVAGVRDPFTGQGTHGLGFLNTPLSMLSGTATVLRGTNRLFEPAHRAGANQASEASPAAGSAATAGPMADIMPTPNVAGVGSAPDVTDWFGLDITTLTVEQLGRLMTACATQMMRSIARPGEPLGS